MRPPPRRAPTAGNGVAKTTPNTKTAASSRKAFGEKQAKDAG